MASEAMLAWLQQIDGYRGLLALVDEEAGSACFVTFWENEDAVVKTRASRSSLRDQMAATAGAEVVGSEEFVVVTAESPGGFRRELSAEEPTSEDGRPTQQ